MEFRIWIIKYGAIGASVRLFALAYELHVLVSKPCMSRRILTSNLYSSIIHIL